LPFDRIHQALRVSGIPYSGIPWPYNPHCTLRGGTPVSAAAAAELLGRFFPGEEFLIDMLSVYHLDPATMESKLLCQRTLGRSD